MKIVEVKGQVDQQHKLHVDATLPSFEPGPVRVIILPPEGHTEADDNREWLMDAMANPAFDKKIEALSCARPMTAGSPATAHLFIVNPFSGGGVLRLFSTHPPIEQRVARLELMARAGLASLR